MSQTDVHEDYEDTLETPSSNTPQGTFSTTDASTSQPQKKRRLDESSSVTISDFNQAKFKVLKKLNIQLTRTKHHISYLTKCDKSKIIPRSLRVNLIPQVPVINSVLQLKWEEAQLNFGHTLTKILLEYWDNRQQSILSEIESIMDVIKQGTTEDEVSHITDVIGRITISIERELSTKRKQVPTDKSPNVNRF